MRAIRLTTLAHLAIVAILALMGTASFSAVSLLATTHRPPHLPAALLNYHGLPVYTWHQGRPYNAGGFALDGGPQPDDLHCVGTNREIGQCMAARRGWTGSQWVCLDHRWGVIESGWSTTATGGGGAYGIPQAEPGNKMAGPNYVQVPGGGYVGNWLTDPWIQIAWGLNYIAERYGAPCNTPWTGGY